MRVNETSQFNRRYHNYW